MLTLAEKVSAVVAIAVIDVALLTFGGVVFAFAAVLASAPLAVSVVGQ